MSAAPWGSDALVRRATGSRPVALSPDRLEANYGGPMSRTRNERIRSTLLGSDDEFVRCPGRLQLALDFGRSDPYEFMKALLEKSGYDSPEDLREVYTNIPPSTLCAVNNGLKPVTARTAPPGEVLAQAFLLGLCTAVYYDPSRPVIWTHASLTRRVELFDMAGFYA